MISFGDYSIIAVLLLLSVKGQSQPIRIPAKLTPTIDACPADQDTDDAKDELRQSISDIITRGNFSCGGTSGWRRVPWLSEYVR